MLLLISIIGWTAGGLVNYLANVLPVQRKLVQPTCPACGYRLSWQRAILGFGSCPACSGHAGPWHPWRDRIVHLAFTAASLWLWLSPPVRLGYWVSLALLIYFGVITVIDIEHRLILHPVSLTGAAFGLGLGLWLNGLTKTLLGGMLGFGIMFGLYLFGILFVRAVSAIRGRSVGDEALGFGDVMLSGVLGLILGWPAVGACLLIAVLLSGFSSLIFILALLVARRYSSFMAIPYGPFLVASTMLILFFPGVLLNLLQ